MNESLDRVHPTIRTKACKSIASLAVSVALVMALENAGHSGVLASVRTVPLASSRTHNRIRSPRLKASGL